MTRPGILKRLSVAFFFVAATGWLPAEEEEEFFPKLQGARASNLYFEVVADDMLSAQYVAMAGDLLGKRFSRMLAPPGRVSRPVLVHLVPAADWESSAHFITRIYPTGQVNVSISWGPATTRDIVERALAQGHLTYLSGAYSPGAVAVPLWLELAAQHLTRAQAIPSHARFLAREAAEGRPMRLETVVSIDRGEGRDDELAPYAYWFLQFLEREGRGRGQLQNFLIRVLRGENGLVAVNAVYGEHLRSVSEAELWWMVGLSDLVRSPRSPVLAAADSRRRVKELSRFAFETGEGEARLFVEDLWNRRISASVQDEVEHRRRLATMEIATVHPYYHNALLSLDRIFEALLAENKDGYREGIVAFRHDLRAGDELSEDTTSILDDLEAELGS